MRTSFFFDTDKQQHIKLCKKTKSIKHNHFHIFYILFQTLPPPCLFSSPCFQKYIYQKNGSFMFEVFLFWHGVTIYRYHGNFCIVPLIWSLTHSFQALFVSSPHFVPIFWHVCFGWKCFDIVVLFFCLCFFVWKFLW